MIVEFVGMSCAGKSTLIREAEQLLQPSGVNVQRHCAGGAERTGFGRQPTTERRRELLLGIRYAPSLALILATQRRGTHRFKHAVHYVQSVAYTHRLTQVAGIHLLDEGPLKRLPKGYGWRPWQLSLMKATVPQTDLIVHVVCDTETRIRRLRQLRRNDLRFTDEQLRKHEASTLSRLREVLDAQGAPVMVVDPNADRQAAERVVNRIAASEHRLT